MEWSGVTTTGATETKPQAEPDAVVGTSLHPLDLFLDGRGVSAIACRVR